LYFGSLKGDGHCLYGPDGYSFWNKDAAMVGETHIDGALAPRRIRIGSRSYYKLEQPSHPVCMLMGETKDDRTRIDLDSGECNQGEFLWHVLPNGFSAVSWWDQCQGDTRPGSSSTILLAGIHRAPEVLEAGKKFFPEVFERLKLKGVLLVDVTQYPIGSPEELATRTRPISPEQFTDFDMAAESSPGFKADPTGSK
jgi:hypothetical protein